MGTVVIKSFQAPLKSLAVIVFRERNWKQDPSNYNFILEVTACTR